MRCARCVFLLPYFLHANPFWRKRTGGTQCQPPTNTLDTPRVYSFAYILRIQNALVHRGCQCLGAKTSEDRNANRTQAIWLYGAFGASIENVYTAAHQAPPDPSQERPGTMFF